MGMCTTITLCVFEVSEKCATHAKMSFDIFDHELCDGTRSQIVVDMYSAMLK